MTVKVEWNATAVLALVGVAVAGAVAWKISGMKLPTAGEVGKKIADAASGTVLGIGDAVGLPRTNTERGLEAVQRGDWGEASVYLSAGDFIHEASNAAASAVTGRPDTLGGAIRGATSNDDERVAAMLRGEPVPPPRSLFNPSTWFN